MSYDVYYATGGGSMVYGGSDVWVNNWLKEIAPKLNHKSKLLIHRRRPENVKIKRDNVDHDQIQSINDTIQQEWNRMSDDKIVKLMKNFFSFKTREMKKIRAENEKKREEKAKASTLKKIAEDLKKKD